MDIAGEGHLVLPRSLAGTVAEEHCPNKSCDATGWNAVGSAKTLQTVSTIALIAGGAAVSAGVVLVLVTPSARENRLTALYPMAIPRGGAIAMTSEF